MDPCDAGVQRLLSAVSEESSLLQAYEILTGCLPHDIADAIVFQFVGVTGFLYYEHDRCCRVCTGCPRGTRLSFFGEVELELYDARVGLIQFRVCDPDNAALRITSASHEVRDCFASLWVRTDGCHRIDGGYTHEWISRLLRVRFFVRAVCGLVSGARIVVSRLIPPFWDVQYELGHEDARLLLGNLN